MKFFQNEGFHVNGKRNNTSLLVERHDPKIKSDFEQERQVPLKKHLVTSTLSIFES